MTKRKRKPKKETPMATNPMRAIPGALVIDLPGGRVAEISERDSDETAQGQTVTRTRVADTLRRMEMAKTINADQKRAGDEFRLVDRVTLAVLRTAFQTRQPDALARARKHMTDKRDEAHGLVKQAASLTERWQAGTRRSIDPEAIMYGPEGDEALRKRIRRLFGRSTELLADVDEIAGLIAKERPHWTPADGAAQHDALPTAETALRAREREVQPGDDKRTQYRKAGKRDPIRALHDHRSINDIDLKAATEIAEVYEAITAPLFAKAQSFDTAGRPPKRSGPPRQLPGVTDRIARLHHDVYLRWAKRIEASPHIEFEMVIDIVVDRCPLDAAERRYGMARRTIIRRLKDALAEWNDLARVKR
jgi:hypothetical protein